MPSSEVSAGGADAARERRKGARGGEGKERVWGLGFVAARWRKRRGSWEVVVETAMARGGRREDEEQWERWVLVYYRPTQYIIRFGAFLFSFQPLQPFLYSQTLHLDPGVYPSIFFRNIV
jgi:hypothetical protein